MEHDTANKIQAAFMAAADAVPGGLTREELAALAMQCLAEATDSKTANVYARIEDLLVEGDVLPREMVK